MVIDTRARRYRRVRFSHKFKRRYLSGEVIAMPGEPLTREQVELYRQDMLEYDTHTPEGA